MPTKTTWDTQQDSEHMKILLVEDDDDLRIALRVRLEQLEHTVVDAPNGRVAMELFPVNDIELVLTDLVMPEKEGLETIRELRKTAPELPIIAMSAGVLGNVTTYLQMAKLLGANAYLAKPFSTSELEAAISEATDGRPSRRPSGH